MSIARRSIAALALLLAVAAAPADVPLRALRWLAPGTDRIAALTTQPTECLSPAAIGDASVEIGRAAFRSPLLLGGQASRAGLSCNACHRQGRGNPDFAFPGLSGAPGTADVTSSLFSSHRGDGIANPVPIPDLSAATHKISRDPASPALADFINGLVVDEFDGAPPPPVVRAGLAAYVRALSPSACPTRAVEPLTLATTLADADRAVVAAQAALTSNDRDTAAVLLLAARSQLGLVNERYAGAALANDRALLRRADADLATALSAVRRGDTAQLDSWRAALPGWRATLAAHENQSLYNPAQMARTLGPA
ncbi:hypothetical protein EUV02_13750 [Polymorphobacter arshaanensis]|uniref:Cytochrome c domain-containing protein n=1 Tax=Glacieibacterium arshaanense TaxID=2511025 RepID=A0A4Y9ELU9_9SPHN|nr:hypothetical protein [Polymorphobacter arshaanensis]TFU01350.1 hypothetical protein EUV02_13750 [Polymorphobacter arshaanensis]